MHVSHPYLGAVVASWQLARTRTRAGDEGDQERQEQPHHAVPGPSSILTSVSSLLMTSVCWRIVPLVPSSASAGCAVQTGYYGPGHQQPPLSVSTLEPRPEQTHTPGYNQREGDLLTRANLAFTDDFHWDLSVYNALDCTAHAQAHTLSILIFLPCHAICTNFNLKRTH